MDSPFPGAASVVRHRSEPAWLAARRQGLGASEAPKILGLSPYGGPFSVWAERLRPAPVSESKRRIFARGHREESRVLEDAAELLGVPFRGPLGYLSVRGPGPLLVTPDAVVVGARPGGAEVKTDRSDYRWGPSRVLEQWDPDAGVREDYACQSYLQMAACGWEYCYLLVRRDLDDLRWYRLERDQALIDGLLEQLSEWWDRHVVRGERPLVDDSRICSDALARMFPPGGEKVSRPANTEEIVLALALAKAETHLDAAESATRLLRNELAARIGESGAYSIEWASGKKKPHKVNYQASGGGVRVDTAALREGHPEIAALYERETPQSRSVRVYLQESK